MLADNGGAILLLEQDCTAEKLFAEIRGLLADPARMEAMSTALRKMTILDSADRICDILEELTSTKG